MKEIGGFFELELNDFGHYYKEAMKLNLGRNALKLDHYSNKMRTMLLT